MLSAGAATKPRISGAASAYTNAGRAAALGATLRLVVDARWALAAAVSEPGQDLTRPATVAVRTADGWTVSGRKSFCTMAPAADLFNVGVAAPMAYFPFSCWKDSFFGDLHAQGRDAIDFYTEKKVVVERWPATWSRKF